MFNDKWEWYKSSNNESTLNGTTYDAILDYGDQTAMLGDANNGFDKTKLRIIGKPFNELLTMVRSGTQPKMLLRYNIVYGDYILPNCAEIIACYCVYINNSYNLKVGAVVITSGELVFVDIILYANGGCTINGVYDS